MKKLVGSSMFMLTLCFLSSCQKRTTDPQAYLAEPKIGDVYIVRFHPEGDTASRYYFYKLYRVTSDSVLFHPARKEATQLDAEVNGADFFATTQTLGYTRNELPGLLKEEPGDVLRTRLVGIRRE
ncbi:hypothetical protein [Hymenobacter cavernae]|nr:hypothetical protein [Hymenobacter cavernae]